MTLEHYLREKYDVDISEVPSAREYLTHAARQPFDAFIVLLNNMIPDAGELFPNNEAHNTFPVIKVDQALQILSFLKQRYRKPVLALTGWWPRQLGCCFQGQESFPRLFWFSTGRWPTFGSSLGKMFGRFATGKG